MACALASSLNARAFIIAMLLNTVFMTLNNVLCHVRTP
jgi:hypothetical protein